MISLKKYILSLAGILCFFSVALGQPKPEISPTQKGPKLVVGIVVDQMRYEYIPRFWEKFGEGGFKRMVNEGFNFANNHYNYFPTYTGPGHASVYTGTTPSVNGIVANDWYDRSLGHSMYVVADSTVQTVGATGKVGKRSPANLWSTTVTDELKLANRSSKVIAVSAKDRAAILPGGHLADGAYWYDGDSGNFVTSTWYRKDLPQWAEDFNAKGLAKELSHKVWNTLLPIAQYTESDADDTPYEAPFKKGEKAVFPYDLKKYAGEAYHIIISTPFGNTLVAEMAKAAVKGEQLGQRGSTDFLAISFSSTDYVGHRFGPRSVELEDTYIRLDRDLAGLYSYLDTAIGKGNYMVFLTADHGAVDVPAELKDRGLPGGYFDSHTAVDSLKNYLDGLYGKADWVKRYMNQQVYLNHELIEAEDIAPEIIQEDAARYLLRFEGVLSTNTATNLASQNYSPDNLQSFYQNGFAYSRSGDVFIQLKAGWLDSSRRQGTSHGSPYNYDTHVPLLFFGWNVPHGSTNRKTLIPEIAPTISTMLQVDLPSGSPGKVLEFKK